MSYWQTLILLYPLSALGFWAGAWTYWRMWRKRRGDPAPRLSAAFSHAWSATTGAAVAMLWHRPGV